MKLTKTETNKHIKETALLIEGVYGRIKFNKDWDIIFHLYWESDKEPSMTFDLISNRESDIKYMLRNQSDDDKTFYIEDNYDKIESKIRKSKEYKDFTNRIKKECEWGDAADKIEDFCWMDDVLEPAEKRVKNLPY